MTIEKGNKVPFPKLTFTKGPPLSTPGPAMEWLGKQRDAAGKPRYVRVPVVLFDSPQGPGYTLTRLYDGTMNGPEIRVFDSALGVPLSDHYRRATEKNDAKSAVMLLTGYWRLPGEKGFFPHRSDEKLYVFDVTHVDGPLPEGAGTHAESAAE